MLPCLPLSTGHRASGEGLLSDWALLSSTEVLQFLFSQLIVQAKHQPKIPQEELVGQFIT